MHVCDHSGITTTVNGVTRCPINPPISAYRNLLILTCVLVRIVICVLVSIVIVVVDLSEMNDCVCLYERVVSGGSGGVISSSVERVVSSSVEGASVEGVVSSSVEGVASEI